MDVKPLGGVAAAYSQRSTPKAARELISPKKNSLIWIEEGQGVKTWQNRLTGHVNFGSVHL